MGLGSFLKSAGRAIGGGISAVASGVSQALGAAAGATKNILSGINKVFKSVISSDLGKIVIAAAVIYTGGVLLGTWGATGPLSGMYGAWGGGAAAVTTGTSEALGATTIPQFAAPNLGATTSEFLASSAAVPSIAEVGASQLPAVGLSASGGVVGGGAGLPALETGIGGGGSTGLNYFQKALGAIKDNQLASFMAFQGLSSALTPDPVTPIDQMREQDRLRKERFESLKGVGNIDLSRLAPQSNQPILSNTTGRPWHERLRGG